MSDTQYTLSAAALATVQQDLAAPVPNYPAAYAAIAQDLAGRADPDTIAWFTNAAQINNSNSPSFMRYFALDYAQAMVASEGGNTANFATTFQNASNTLARNTLTNIVSSGQTPSFAVLGPQDTQNAAKTLGGNFLAWPGYAELCQPNDPVFQNTDYLNSLSIAQQASVLSACMVAGPEALAQSGILPNVPDVLNGFSTFLRLWGLSDLLTTSPYGAGGFIKSEAGQELQQMIGLVDSSATPNSSEISSFAALADSQAAEVHLVQSGDTYTTIAQSLDDPAITAATLADLNGDSLNDPLVAGTAVLLPAQATTLGGSGVTLSALSAGQSYVIDAKSGILLTAPDFAPGASADALTVLGGAGGDLASIAAGSATSAALSGGVLQISLTAGTGSGQLDINTSNGSGSYSVGGTFQGSGKNLVSQSPF